MSNNPQNSNQHDAAEVDKYVSSQKKVFVGLIIFTLVAVTAAYLPFGSIKAHTVVVAIAVLINAFLVAGISMHLLTEKKTITQFLIFTVIFGGFLFALTALAYFDSTGHHH